MKAKMVIGIAIFILGCSLPSFAQMTAYANIFAEVIAPVGIEKSADLTFNQITSQKSATVVLGSDDFTRTGNGTVASFSIRGANQTTFDVTLPKESFTIGNGDSNMTISNFTSTATPANALQNRSGVVKIGATLNVPDNQVPGNYLAQNHFPVTLNYN